MSALKKYEKPALIGVAIFCLVIFSVTPQMTSVFAGILGNGPQPMATIEIGGEKKTIDLEAYRQARNLFSLARTFSGGPRTGGERSEDVVTFAALRMLADEFQLEATDAMLLDQLRPLIQQLGSQEQYARFYKSLGYSTARSFENVLREVLRVNLMKSLLATGTIPTTEEVLDLWARNNEEMRLQFAVWRADEFIEAAAKAEPKEEELKAFFENGLTPAQKHDLEKEETVTFDAVVLTPEAMETEAVKKWAGAEEPSEDSIQGFYNFHRFDLYRRPLPEEGQEIDPSQGVFFDLKEIHDRVVRDFRMDKAAQLLRNELAESEDPAALAKEKGAEFQSFSEPIPRSEIEKLPRIGSPRLQVLFQGEVGTWTAQTLFGDGVAFLARPTAKTDRALPPLEEVR
ncbi:MAG: hypothetical protein ACE5H3_12120, partial [Planctomycetota bacterium]